MKKFLTRILVLALIVNAGFDFGSWVMKRNAEGDAARAAIATGVVGEVHAVQCLPFSEGWVCDLDVTLIDGNRGHIVKAYPKEIR